MGTRKLSGTPIALGVMDVQFMGGSMGLVVGEKITRLVEYAYQKIYAGNYCVFFWKSTNARRNFKFNANG
jgi:acetyl-CoA carboxylase beta subunit